MFEQFESGWADAGSESLATANPQGAGVFAALSDALAVNLAFTTDNQCTVRVTARSTLSAPSDLIALRVPLRHLHERLAAETVTMLVNSGFTHGDAVGLIHFSAGGEMRKEPEKTRPFADWWTVFGASDGSRYLLIGHLTPVRHRAFIRVRNGHLECGCRLQRQLQPGDGFVMDTLTWMEGGDLHELLERFGRRCAELTPARPPRPRRVAWNSWDYYFSIFTEDDLDDNLDALAALRDQGVADVQHVVIDMGWFVDFGEWIHNGRFPRGMQAAAARIKSRGFTPGIWVAPFIVHFMSTTFLRHPEALATDAKGQVMIDQWGLAPNGWLDPTKPDGRDLLHGWFKRLRDAGFEYFKTDFVHYLITKVESRCFHQNDLGRMEIVRQGMQIIRDAIGDDAFLLACGCPPEAVLGIADACRIGGDISTYFSTTRLAAPMLAGRYWMNNRFWANDPDFLIVRGDATADDVHHNPFHAANLAEPGGSRSGPPWANEQEPRIWATLVGMSGGMLTLADHAGRLNRIGRGMVRTVMAHADDEAARPLDLMERLLPRYWLRTGRHPALAVVNWDDEASSFDLPAGRWPALERFAGAASLWGNGEIRAENGTLTVRVSGRDAVWFKLQG